MNRAKNMKAAVVTCFKTPFKITNVPVPVPKEGEVLVKVMASGCCHTDLHAIEGDWPVKPKMPLTPGHEGAGVVEAVGPGVTNWKVGDRIGIPWLHSACGYCEYCITGRETLCAQQQNTGYSVDGCFREYAIAHASHGIRLPEKISFEQVAPILCAGVTSYKGLKQTETKPGQFVSIIGAAGGLGHLAVQYAKAMGMRPIALDIGEGKEKICRDMGAEHYVDAASPDAVDNVLKYTDGGCHGVLCLAAKPQAVSMALNLCRSGGCAVCCGLPSGASEVPIFGVVLKALTLRGSIVGTRHDMMEALDFADRGLVHCKIETKRIEDLNDIYGKMKRNQIAGRVVLKFNH